MRTGCYICWCLHLYCSVHVVVGAVLAGSGMTVMGLMAPPTDHNLDLGQIRPIMIQNSERSDISWSRPGTDQTHHNPDLGQVRQIIIQISDRSDRSYLDIGQIRQIMI